MYMMEIIFSMLILFWSIFYYFYIKYLRVWEINDEVEPNFNYQMF